MYFKIHFHASLGRETLAIIIEYFKFLLWLVPCFYNDFLFRE